MGRFLRHRWAKIAAQVVVLTALVLGVVAFVGNNKSVTLTVDGRASSISTFGKTVQDVLDEAEVSVDPLDKLTPAAAEPVKDGTSIEVVTAKPVTVSVDGDKTTVQSTSATVSDLLDELGVAKDSALSVPLSAELASVSNVTITTPKTVTITADGRTKKKISTAATVGQLLQEQHIKLGKDDKLSKPQAKEVTDGLKVTIVRVDKSQTVKVVEAIPFSTKTTEDSSMYADQEKVSQAGEAGSRTKVYAIVLEDGTETERELVSDKVTREPVARKVVVGTKERPKPAADTSNVGGTWQALAQCESGGNWSINTGNGYYGGLQFSQSSWLGAGGGQYAPYPHMASASEQIAVAETLRSSGGWGHWPACAAKLGLL
ncbi:ubiquitin-like domain-containing protein [Arthrobacter hankyongi]|uniref:ubiquitin-like domain-containing protein n=1 Tax=Arthrobacter hankyongi TaxID=2904801 RepID=UPI0027DF5155|nr:ubiquitin-like domain-containing protein [Arthrobacter hankyongi]